MKKLFEEYVERFIFYLILVIIVAIYLWFSTYNNDFSLTCSRQNNLCTIKQTNLYGHNKQYKTFELSNVIKADHYITSIKRNSPINRPFSALHEFVILQKDNKLIKVYSVTSSNSYKIMDINNYVSEFNNFIDNNKIEQLTIENF